MVGSSTCKMACRAYMRDLDALHRCEVINIYYVDRMMRKYEYIKEVYKRVYNNWNQTFYHMLFRMLDVGANRAAFEKLSERVDYNCILHERFNPKAVEAILIGASGLLDLYREDKYIVRLKRDAEFLLKKHEIEPMSFDDWVLRGVRPQNHPVLRLSQLAAFFGRYDLVMNQILECRSAEDVEQLFGVEALPYWDSHFIPARSSHGVPKRIGREKSLIFAINIVVPLQFAYGSHYRDDELTMRATTLLESLAAEDNRYIREWASYGVKASDALESQALLQIVKEYCEKGRCKECYIGRRVAELQQRFREQHDAGPMRIMNRGL